MPQIKGQIVLDAEHPRTEVHPILKENFSLGNLLLCRYSIDDGEAVHRSAPETYFVPSAQERAAVQPGEYVRLTFRLEVESRSIAERMWVRITRRDGDSYIGRLANNPGSITFLRFGDLVRFKAKNVIKIAAADAGSSQVLSQANVRLVKSEMHGA